MSDMIDTLPDDEFAPWQLKLMPEHLETTLVAQGAWGQRLVTRSATQPSFTITANSNQACLRAFIVNGTPNNYGSSLTVREGKEPVFTITASVYKRPIRARVPDGRVVRMTLRAVARLQSVPDWYELPDSDTLACKVIGNGVPCLLMQRVIEAQCARGDTKAT